jgi:Concanavalin A-like lectin/glucanases superfamily
MAVRFDAAADRLLRTSGLIDYNAAYTVMGWVYLVSDLNAYGAIFSLNTGDVAQDLDYIGVNADGVSLISYVDIAATPTEVDSGYNFTVATWAHLAIVRASATSLQVYINGVAQGSANTQNVAGRTAATRMEFGAVGTGNIDRANARVQHVKIWSTNLSAAEILQEYQVARPVRTDSLHLWTPLWGAADIADYSGNARDWTAGGTLTTEDGPPVSYGAPVQVAPYAATAAGTYTATGALTSPAITASGSGTFTAPPATYTGSGALTSPALTLSGSGTRTVPTFTGSGALTSPALTMSGSGVRLEGGGHLRFYGSDPVTYNDVDRVRIPLRSGGSPTAVDVGAGDFTYEMWVRCAYADNTSTSTTDWRYSNILFDRDAWNSVRGHGLGVARSGSNLVAVFGVAGASLTHVSIAGTTNIGDGAPHHIAVVRRQSTGVIELYVDGALEDSGTYTTGDLSYDDSNAGGQDNDAIILGREKHDVGVGFAGRLDSLRISNSRRYTTAFSRPTAPLTVDANTVGLWQFDDAAGLQATDDASGVHGTLQVGGPSSGPTWATPDLLPATGTGALTSPALTMAGSGTFTAPAYTGSGALNAPAATISGTGTHTAPAFTGSGALTAPSATVTGSGAFTAPVYTGSGDLTSPALTMSGSGIFASAVYSGSGALTAPAATMSGSGTFTAPVYTGSGALVAPAATIAGDGTHTAPVFTGSGALILPAITGAGSGTFGAVVYTGSGAIQLPAITASGVGTFTPPVYTGSGALVLPALTMIGSGTFTSPGSALSPSHVARGRAEPTIFRAPREATIARGRAEPTVSRGDHGDA